MKEYTLREAQEICDRIGARLRLSLPSRNETGEQLCTAVLAMPGTVAAAQGESFDEAFSRALKRVREG
jgi:hypothetical protein